MGSSSIPEWISKLTRDDGNVQLFTPFEPAMRSKGRDPPRRYPGVAARAMRADSITDPLRSEAVVVVGDTGQTAHNERLMLAGPAAYGFGERQGGSGSVR